MTLMNLSCWYFTSILLAIDLAKDQKQMLVYLGEFSWFSNSYKGYFEKKLKNSWIPHITKAPSREIEKHQCYLFFYLPFEVFQLLWQKHNIYSAKGHLISKCPFGIFNPAKKRTKKFDSITMVSTSSRNVLKNLKTPKRHFEINCPLLHS